MHAPTLLPLFALLATALPAPIPQCSSTAPPGFPGSASANTTSAAQTTITYTQGTFPPASSTCGTLDASTGLLNASECMTFHTYGAKIAQVPGDECTFTLYKGSQDCGLGLGENGVQGDVVKSVVVVPAGEGQTCVVSGVRDGGWLQEASGVWACA